MQHQSITHPITHRAQISGIIGAFCILLLGVGANPTLANTRKKQASASKAFPMLKRVDAQPLLAQARRLREALEFLGEPLSAKERQVLDAAERETDDSKVTAMLQKVFDARCLAAVHIRKDAPLQVMRAPGKPTLYEQGWRLHLVKIVNETGATETLRVQSPNARPLPQSPPSAVKERWFDVQSYTNRPLNPSLSGLALEYQVLQLYSRHAGDHTATLEFNVGNVPATRRNTRRPLRREWNFGAGATDWKALNDCTIETRKNALTIRTKNNDPYIAAPVRLPGGTLRLRMRARIDHEDMGQVFWATEDHPQFDGNRQVAFPFTPRKGTWQEISVTFQAVGDLSQLRLDLGGKPGLVEIDWIELSVVDNPGSVWTPVSISFRCLPSQSVTFRVRDEKNMPATASFVIRDSLGRVYPAQAKRLAPDFFFHSQIYRADGETLRLPEGVYTVDCRRGPESFPETQKLTVGKRPLSFEYRVKRWIDPAEFGWWSGDHHIHAAGCAHYTNPTEGVFPPDMARQCLGEDLKVGCNLTWGPCFDFQKQFFTGGVDKASRYPYLLRYDIEVSGFGSHQSGHLCLLRLKEQIYPGGTSDRHWPTLCLNTLKWAKKQGAVCGTAHSANGLVGSVGRVAPNDGPNGLPTYAIPPFDGIGAMEYIVDVTHEVPGPDGKMVPAIDFLATMDTDPIAELNIWYHTLNCGFRTRVSGETDFPCISGERVGMGRSYAKLDGKLTFDSWCDSIREGRCYISDGSSHLMEFQLNGLGVGEKGSEVRLKEPGTVAIKAKAAALRQSAGGSHAEAIVEVVVNGYPVAKQVVPADGKTRDLTFEVKVERSSWVAVRVLGSAHTNPIFVLVNDRPIRASKRSAEWCLRSVDQCWSQKQRFIAPAEMTEAERAYQHARETYRRLLGEMETE